MPQTATAKFLDAISTIAFGRPASESKAENICVSCQKPPNLEDFTPAGKAEFAITGMCEPCFDSLFAEEPE